MSSMFARAVQRRVPEYDEPDEAWFDHEPDHHDLPVEVEPVQSLRDSFLDAVRSRLTQDPRITQKKWVRKWVQRNSGGGCMYCGHAVALDLDTRAASNDQPLPSSSLRSVIAAAVACFLVTTVGVDRAWMNHWTLRHPDVLTAHRRRAFMDTLIPMSAGGTSHQSNLTIACTTCYAEKGDRDWITFGKAVLPDVLEEKRREALRDAANHVLPLTVKGTRAARAVLARRWDHARFRVFAGVFDTCGFFAWDSRTLPPSSGIVLALRSAFGARVSSVEGDEHLVAAELAPDTWFDAAWTMLEDNVLLQPVELSGPAALVYRPYRPALDAEHQERWNVLLKGSRWEQEARRVKRWSLQASVLQRDLERAERERAARKPLLDGLSDARTRIAQLFVEVM
ncbi:hypothetical protein [Burkholderia glumae]|uniref:hypothetical protein n=1 Tax=Burkholderia glumae TaxID=337 RepID=UPI00214FDF3A|nr:hypothetical protein [Burkholderia glumae]